jgi:protein SCO1/2
MAGWFKTLGPDADGVKAFFFSVDPERDTPELMHNYTSAFTNRITGVTGDPAEMEKVIKSWNIYAKKVPTQDGDYTMDHTASVLLLDKKGNMKGTISYGSTAETAVTKIRDLIGKT